MTDSLICFSVLSCSAAMKADDSLAAVVLKVWFLISYVYHHRICVSSQIKFYIKDINISTAMTSQRPSSNMDQHVLNLAKIENVH